MKRWIVAVLVLLVGVGVLSDLTWRKRKQERALRDDEVAVDRYIDVGVVLRVVVQDQDGDELLAGKPKLRVIRSHAFGGIVDARARPPRFIGPSQEPAVWYASEDQEAALLHDGPELGQLIYGSEGAGKTTLLAQWHYLRWIEHLGERREGGQTAPTKKRLKLFRDELFKLWRSDWYEHRKAEDVFILCDGTRIQLVSTHRQSEDQGAPIQGYNWSWCGRDELQDQIDAHADIESRGRAARGGGKYFKQLATATAKDNPRWRSLRALLLSSGKWVRRTLLITRSPFVSPAFLEERRASMSEREFRRRYGAEDLLPELAVYPAWNRELNTIRIPEFGWEDVTALELARWGANLAMLCGHDPGALFDVTLCLRAFRTPRMKPTQRCLWVVVDEITTERTTTEQHVDALLKRIREHWRMNLLARDPATGLWRTNSELPRIFVRADPYGNNDSKPDRSCYTVFRNAGIKIEPAAYSTHAPEPGTAPKPGRVPKEAGIEVINTLLCNAANERRLYVALDAQGQPVAPRFVEALETSERDSDGKAETQRKDVRDVSHWPAAGRYALWVLERPRLQAAP